MKRSYSTFSCLLVLVIAASCSGGTDSVLQSGATPDPVLNQQMTDAIIETEAIVSSMLESEIVELAAATAGDKSGTRTVNITFDRTRACPLGGEVSIAGELTDVFEWDTLTRETSFAGTKTVVGCTVQRGGQALVLDGSAQWDAFRRRVAFRPDGLQRASYEGSITALREDGATGTCSFAIEVMLDPDARTRSLSVSVCGNVYEATVTWAPR